MKALLFPGQGSQSVGMGSEFYKNFDIVKKIFKEAEKTKAGITESKPPRYASKTDFYIQKRDQKPELIKISRKSLINFFENQSEIKKFIKENKLKVAKIESVISIIEFADKITDL